MFIKVKANMRMSSIFFPNSDDIVININKITRIYGTEIASGEKITRIEIDGAKDVATEMPLREVEDLLFRATKVNPTSKTGPTSFKSGYDAP